MCEESTYICVHACAARRSIFNTFLALFLRDGYSHGLLSHQISLTSSYQNKKTKTQREMPPVYNQVLAKGVQRTS